MRRLALALLVLLALPGPALAHRLKVFAAVRDQAITGHAFFVGGGRPRDVPYRIRDGSGRAVHEGRTDGQGAFFWPAPGPSDYTVTVDAGDGHVASASIPAARFLGGPADPPAAAPAAGAPAPPDTDSGAPVEALVSAAVQEAMEPLLERIEEMDSRMRLTDILSGIFLILGAAGGLLWLAGRRGAR